MTSHQPGDSIAAVLDRLAAVDAERLALTASLRSAGFRSRGFVGEYGELLIEAAYPGSRRAAASQPGYDLTVDGLGLVQVKTLRSTPTNHRTTMGVMREPYEVLVALRLDVSYHPVAAWEIPRQAVEAVYPHGRRTSLTAKLIGQPGVRAIEASCLKAAVRSVGRGLLRGHGTPPLAGELAHEE